MTSHALLNGTITDTGGANADERGFEWGTTQGGPYPNSWTEAGSFGAAAYSHQVTGLTEGTTWYYRAKAHNSAGWGYGAEASFVTVLGVSVADSGTGSDSADTAPVVFVAESGAGQDSLALNVDVSPTDTGHGAEALAVSAAVAVAETGAGVESSLIQNSLTQADGGLGSDGLEISGIITIPDSGVGVEAPSLVASIPISDSAVGSETVTPTSAFTVADSGLGLENVTTPGTLTVIDEGKGAEFAWRRKPSTPMIDDLALPHVLSIRISDPATMSDKKVQGGALPRRKMVGKPGRIVEIEGWTKDQDDIDDMEALVDGTARTFLHPSGDSFAVLVTDFDPESRVDEYDRRIYRLTLKETR